jgi:hypothetical protein
VCTGSVSPGPHRQQFETKQVLTTLLTVQDLEVDHVQALLQSKVHDVEAQAKEFAAMTAAYNKMMIRLAAHADERRALSRRIAKLEEQLKAAGRDAELARHAANDSAKQVARLYEELHKARGLVPPPRGCMPFPTSLPDSREGALMDAQALISKEFQEPADLDALLEMSRRLRTALRAVADDSEAKAQQRQQCVEEELGPKLQVRTQAVGVIVPENWLRAGFLPDVLLVCSVRHDLVSVGCTQARASDIHTVMTAPSTRGCPCIHLFMALALSGASPKWPPSTC